jgi:hypothetical protein
MKAQAVALKRHVMAFRTHVTEEMKAAMPPVNELRVRTAKALVEYYGEAESTQGAAITQKPEKQGRSGEPCSMSARRNEPSGAVAHAGVGKNSAVEVEEFEEF